MIGIFISSIINAATWSDVKQFNKYKFVRSVAIEADSELNTFVAVTNYKNAGEIAATYSKIEYSLNQFNSAALCLIKKYKEIKDISLIKEAFDILSQIQNTIEEQNITNIQLLKAVNNNTDYCQDILNKVKYANKNN
jgi:hypothetical protein